MSSCHALTASDDLEVFQWTCREEDNQAVFFSTGFQPDKGLADLVTEQGTGWRDNHLVVYKDGVLFAQSGPDKWWENRVRPLVIKDSDTDLTVISEDQGYQKGEILTIPLSQSAHGIYLNMDQVALVVLRDAQLSFRGKDPNYNSGNGTNQSPDVTCLIFSANHRYLWIEGAMGGKTWHQTGLSLFNIDFARVHRFTTDNNWDGITLNNVTFSSFTEIQISQVGGYGLDIQQSRQCLFSEIKVMTAQIGLRLINSHENRIKHLRCSANKSRGVIVHASNSNILTNVTISGTWGVSIPPDLSGDPKAQYFGRGLMLHYGSENNTFSRLHVSNCQTHGILGHASPKNTFAHVTTLNNETGINFQGPIENTIVSLLSANNANTGIMATGTNRNIHFVNVGSANNGKHAIYLADSVDHTFSGHLYVGNTSGGKLCTVSYPANPDQQNTSGLINDYCTDTGKEDTNTYQGQTSDAHLHPSIGLSQAFVGKVTQDDQNNDGDLNGTQTCGPETTDSSEHCTNIQDWLNFDNPYRCWGPEAPSDSTGSLDPGIRLNCREDPCRIWDWRIVSTAGGPIFNCADSPFEEDKDCPARVSGDVYVTDQQDEPNMFLINALEIVDDDIGDNDGLCESSERCIYAPHELGAYQGEGKLSARPCLFQNSTSPAGVNDVLLYAYQRPCAEL